MQQSNAGIVSVPENGAGVQDWPREVELILSALESGQHARAERRAVRRAPYRSEARLHLFADTLTRKACVLYTRDVCTRGMGFVTPHQLPLGYGGILHLSMPSGRVGQMQCTLCRCRQVSPGWYEGALNFSREQAEFEALMG